MLTIEALLMLSTLSEATTLNRIILDNKRAEERYRKMNVSNIGHIPIPKQNCSFYLSLVYSQNIPIFLSSRYSKNIHQNECVSKFNLHWLIALFYFKSRQGKKQGHHTLAYYSSSSSKSCYPSTLPYLQFYYYQIITESKEMTSAMRCFVNILTRI